MKKLEQLYEGKAKKVFATDDPNVVLVDYKDDATAFNGLKKGTIMGKGVINNRVTNFLMKMLEKNGIPTHYIEEISDRETLVKKVHIVPLEVIVRNIAAGSLSKRLGLPEGTKLKQTVLEYCYKDDELGDPMVNEYHIMAMGWVSKPVLDQIAAYALRINELLTAYLKEVNIELIDFKLEFGITNDGQLVLADEINRAPAKTQSALLEAMQERRVTVMGRTFTLLPPLFVLSTPNPIEQEGTYPLPEAQLDRFLFKVLVKFPDRQELREIVELTEGNHPPKIAKVMDRESLLAARACVAQIPIADAVMDYILDLVMATHADNPYIREGASPRAAQALIRTARARAFMENRLNVSFEDVKCVALPVLRHRILLSFDAVSEGITEDAVIGQILTEKEQGLYA